MADNPTTLSPDNKSRLSNNEWASSFGATNSYTITADDINGTNNTLVSDLDGDTVTVTITATPGDYYIPKGFVYVKEDFGPTPGTITTSLGSDSDPDILVVAAVMVPGIHEGSIGGNWASGATAYKGTSSEDIVVQFDFSGSAPSSATVGELTVFLAVQDNSAIELGN